MKRCPACNRTYTDDALLFCLEDGTQLMQAGAAGDSSAAFDPNATLALSQPRDTNPPPEIYYPQASAQAPAHPPWNQPPYTPAATHPAGKPGSKAWLIFAIAGVVVLGIGIVVLLAIIGGNAEDSPNKNANAPVVTGANGNSAASTPRRETTATPSTMLKDDFSTERWPTGERGYGSYYQDGQYHMKGRPSLYLFMFPLNNNASDLVNYTSRDATVKVTTRSVDGKSPSYGYGLVMHGKVNSKGNLEGYGFLVHTSERPKYGIVRFADGKPTDVIAWKESAVIRSGTSPNQIEVRAKGTQLSYYVNGQFLDSITDTANYTEGYVGLYTTETSEVAFDDMEISR